MNFEMLHDEELNAWYKLKVVHILRMHPDLHVLVGDCVRPDSTTEYLISLFKELSGLVKAHEVSQRNAAR